MNTQPLPSLPRDTRFLEPYLERAGISVAAADDVILGRMQITPAHWKAATFLMDDAYLRCFAYRWLRGWSFGKHVPLQWTSSLIVHLRMLRRDYHRVLGEFLVKGTTPPPDLLHADVLDADTIAVLVRARPNLLWHRRTGDWLLPLLFQLEDPWPTLMMGSPRFLKACLQYSRKGALLACVLYAPQYLDIVLKRAPPSELYVYDEEGLSLLQMTTDQPYLFCDLARAGCPREGVREKLLVAVRERQITSQDFRMMRRALGDRVYTDCICC